MFTKSFILIGVIVSCNAFAMDEREAARWLDMKHLLSKYFPISSDCIIGDQLSFKSDNSNEANNSTVLDSSNVENVLAREIFPSSDHEKEIAKILNNYKGNDFDTAQKIKSLSDLCLFIIVDQLNELNLKQLSGLAEVYPQIKYGVYGADINKVVVFSNDTLEALKRNEYLFKTCQKLSATLSSLKFISRSRQPENAKLPVFSSNAAYMGIIRQRVVKSSGVEYYRKHSLGRELSDSFRKILPNRYIH